MVESYEVLGGVEERSGGEREAGGKGLSRNAERKGRRRFKTVLTLQVLVTGRSYGVN